MSHANAAMTARHRLRIARLIVNDGWPSFWLPASSTCHARPRSGGRNDMRRWVAQGLLIGRVNDA